MPPDEDNYEAHGTRPGPPAGTAKPVAVPFVPDLAVSSKIPSLFQSTTAEPGPGETGAPLAAAPPYASAQAVTGEPKARYDVYAKSYIPQSLRAINEEVPRNVIDTKTKHKIAFESYTAPFAGRDFLQSRSASDFSSPQVAPLYISEITEQSYAQHLKYLLQQESAVQMERNQTFVLFAVPLQAILMPDGTRLWAAVVPGLREDDPLIELGDILQVRQLWVNWAGSPICYATQVSTSMSMTAEYGVYAADCTWTGTQFNASVCGVSRVRETVYLRVDCLQHIAPFNN